MADAVSHSSLDSAGDEYVIVNGEPRLKIANNGNPQELEKKMREVLDQTDIPSPDGKVKVMETKPKEIPLPDAKSPSSASDPDEESTIFTGVTYLGSATVNAPRSEMEINRNMQILNEQSQMAIPITLSVPCTSEGTVYLLDPSNEGEIASYKIHRILFCARGPTDSDEYSCFAFTCSHGDTPETTIFQCHVFRTDTQEMNTPVNVGKILYSFATAFRRIAKSPSTISSHSITPDNSFQFLVTLDVKEDDGKGTFSTCPSDRNVYKLRTDVEKKLCISVLQVSSNRDLKIERCFGLLISPGRNVKHSDMQLIEMVSMGAGSDGKTYTISGQWDPTDPSFQILNTETPKDTRVFMTIAVDLVIQGIQEPVRFLIETKAKIFPANERFWYFSKKPHTEQFILKLKEVENCNPSGLCPGEMQYEVVSCRSQTEMDREKAAMTLTLSPQKMHAQNIPTPGDPEGEESDNDEPLMSGSGIVSKDVMDENLLEEWREALTKWHQHLKQRPKQINGLVRNGVPEALRGEVWQLLAGCQDNSEMLEAYRILITKESSCEQTILRDINRTFPAHDYFRETGGVGQDSLYKISKAYSVYDEEVGYCQGISFLAAALLLHMPEEQAFCVLVKVMFDYGMRELFKQGFEELHLKFYQLERLMQDQLSDLFEHFAELGLEAHMYASQWFLTLFTAKFPLFMVFHILDIFLSEGQEVIFRVAIALLKTSRKDLLALDFEGVLKYFRVSLPKKYRSEESARELISTAVTNKVSSRKLKKYEKEYMAIKENQMQQEDPVERLERENKRLLESNMRLEQENDDLAHELVTSKISLRNDLDLTEDKCEVLSKELLQAKGQLIDTEDEKKRLTNEAALLKGMFREAQEKADTENTRNQAIINDYKQICSQLSERLEKQQAVNRDELQRFKGLIEQCESCNKLVSEDGHLTKVVVPPPSEISINPVIVERDRTIRELELELAQTKLALVESECRVGDLTHELNATITELQGTKNNWFQKTLTSIREVTTTSSSKKDGIVGGATGTKKDGQILTKSLSRENMAKKDTDVVN